MRTPRPTIAATCSCESAGSFSSASAALSASAISPALATSVPSRSKMTPR
jgi:hypothetical protein